MKLNDRSSLLQLVAPLALVVGAGLISLGVSAAIEIYFLTAIVMTAIVVSISVFVGNSGVISFGQISFVAIGAFSSGVLTIPAESKRGVLPTLFPILRDHTMGNVPSLLLATALGGVFALVLGMPLMRLNGLAAGIATFAVLMIVHNLFREWDKIGPGAMTLSLIPESTGVLQATVGTCVVIVVAWVYRRSRPGRMVCASREDARAAAAAGINVHRQRLFAFTLSGALAGLSGGLYVHMLGSITADQVFLDLTFLTLAMLVFGGAASLWGAVVGALAVSGLSSFLSQSEDSVNLGFRFHLPQGGRLVILGVVMAAVLILKPSGITGGREFSLDGAAALARRLARSSISRGGTQ